MKKHEWNVTNKFNLGNLIRHCPICKSRQMKLPLDLIQTDDPSEDRWFPDIDNDCSLVLVGKILGE